MAAIASDGFHTCQHAFSPVMAPRRLMRAAMWSILLAAATYTTTDPDLWGHVRFGLDMIRGAGVPSPDLYSFTSDRTWINHEWLAEIAMAGAFRMAGDYGLIALKVAANAVMMLLLNAALRSEQLEAPIARDTAAAVALVLTMEQLRHVRPQLFSIACFAAVMWYVSTSRRRSPAWLLLAPPLFALWANLHGGWLVGGAVLALWIVAAAPTFDLRRNAFNLAIGIGSLGATLLTPYHLRLWIFLRDTVAFSRADIVEWQPVYALGTPYVIIWLFIAGVATALLVQRVRQRTVDPASFTLVLLFAFASFRVNRLEAFFAIAAAMLLAGGWRAVVDRQRASPPPSRASLVVAGFIGAGLLAGALIVTIQNVACVRIPDEGYPEREAAPAMAAAGLHGRMLTFFDWGEYAIWYLPQLSVSLDGRRETVYSDATVDTQVALYFDPSTRRAALQRWQPEYAWLPTRLPLTAALKADGWSTLFAGQQSTVLSARPAKPFDVPRLAGGRRCFPGP